MENYGIVNPQDFKENPIKLIGSDWALLTAGEMDSFNTMTVSWGGVGVLWGKNVAFIFVRPQRYTYEFTEKGDNVTLSFYEEDFKNKLAFCGAKSGREVDKVKECGLTPKNFGEGVAFAEAKYVMECKIIHSQFIEKDGFRDKTIEDNYKLGDYHKMYVAEIMNIYAKNH